jgi:3-hydroxyisobutyrate dehydrogenase-like beta-hydroxyacid dehydrogenase
MKERTVGLIGVGLMGSALAERLLASGIRVIGHDQSEERRESLMALGGVWSPTPQDVFQRCELVLLALPDAKVAKRVLQENLTGELREGLTIIDTGTGGPDEVAAIGQELEARGIRYLDATIAGSSEQMRRREAPMLVGGAADVVQSLSPLWEALGPHWFYVGSCGSGARMKLVSNLVMGLNRAALAEGLALAEACGLDPELTLTVLRAGNAYSRILDMKGRKMIDRDFAPQARLRQHVKDVDLILALAESAGAHVPLSEAHGNLLSEAMKRGLGELDNSAVILALAAENDSKKA